MSTLQCITLFSRLDAHPATDATSLHSSDETFKAAGETPNATQETANIKETPNRPSAIYEDIVESTMEMSMTLNESYGMSSATHQVLYDYASVSPRTGPDCQRPP